MFTLLYAANQIFIIKQVKRMRSGKYHSEDVVSGDELNIPPSAENLKFLHEVAI
jgi:hypothetical protein